MNIGDVPRDATRQEFRRLALSESLDDFRYA